MSVVHCSMKLVGVGDDWVTEKQFIVGAFMAQKYSKGASISTFLPTDLKEYLKDSVNQDETPERRRRSSVHSVTSISSKASKSSRREVVVVNEEVIEMAEEEWIVSEEDLRTPKTILFKTISTDGELKEKEGNEFFKSIDLNAGEIEKMWVKRA